MTLRATVIFLLGLMMGLAVRMLTFYTETLGFGEAFSNGAPARAAMEAWK